MALQHSDWKPPRLTTTGISHEPCDRCEYTIVCCKRKPGVQSIVTAPHSTSCRCRSGSKPWLGVKRTITLDEADNQRIVQCMIEYFCSLDYDGWVAARALFLQGDYSLDGSVSQLVFHAHVYILAHKHDVPGLKRLALWKFRLVMENIEDSAADLVSATFALTEHVALLGLYSELREALVDGWECGCYEIDAVQRERVNDLVRISAWLPSDLCTWNDLPTVPVAQEGFGLGAACWRFPQSDTRFAGATEKRFGDLVRENPWFHLGIAKDGLLQVPVMPWAREEDAGLRAAYRRFLLTKRI